MLLYITNITIRYMSLLGSLTAKLFRPAAELAAEVESWRRASFGSAHVVGIALRTGRMETVDGKDDRLGYGAV